MKSSALIPIILLFISGMAICRANLGETEAQIIARYGSESEVKTDLGYRQVGDKAATFTVKTPAGSLSIRVTFLHGSSCHELFANADSSHGLTADQLKGILNSQAAGLEWEKGRTVYRSAYAGDTYGTTDWLRSDGATARFYMSGKASSQNLSGQVDFSTKQYAYAQRIYDKENGDN